MESLQRFSGQTVQRDDLTLVTLKRIPLQIG
jgi:serine phosphatase RsbU (regulator of sigma subunit)